MIARRCSLTAVVVAVVLALASATAQAARIDPAFGAAGTTVLARPKKGVDTGFVASAVRPTGGFVVATSTEYNGDDFDVLWVNKWNIAAFTQDGKLDRSFGKGGRLVFDPRGYAARTWGSDPTAIAVQSDGKILVGGIVDVATARDEREYESEYPDGEVDCSCFAARAAFVVARFNPNGKLDKSFGTAGTTMIRGVSKSWTENGFLSSFSQLLIAPDGKIVLVGDSLFYTDGLYYNAADRNRLLAYRLTSRGRLDRSFGTKGRILRAIGSKHGGFFLRRARLVGSNLVVAGYTERQSKNRSIISNAAARLTLKGKLDPSYGTAGYREVTNHMGWVTPTPEIFEDGRVSFLSQSYQSEPDPDDGGKVTSTRILRLAENGSPDPAFGNAGWIDLPAGNDTFEGDALVSRADGALTVVVSNGEDGDPIVFEVGSAGALVSQESFGIARENAKFRVGALLPVGEGTIVSGTVESGDAVRLFLARLRSPA